MFLFKNITLCFVILLIGCTSNNSTQKYKTDNNSFYGGIYSYDLIDGKYIILQMIRIMMK